jgi:5-methylcytosine-specific restriction endonuclease McrA
MCKQDFKTIEPKEGFCNHCKNNKMSSFVIKRKRVCEKCGNELSNKNHRTRLCPSCSIKTQREIPLKLRFEILCRDNFTCQYCGRKAPNVILQVDHIAPFSRGGKTEVKNLITSCRECNIGKSDSPLVKHEAIF